jgi:hypothetical protein
MLDLASVETSESYHASLDVFSNVVTKTHVVWVQTSMCYVSSEFFYHMDVMLFACLSTWM